MICSIFSRIAQGKMLLQKERVVLQAVIDNALEMAKPAIESHGHRLSFEPGVIPTVELDADPLRVSQAIANLLTNAAKYTPVGGRIELKVQTHSEALSVIVKDSGIGLDSTSLKHVFEPFYQVGSALPRSEGGLGIGLALVKSMINLHGGNVEARSDGLGLGSEFTITLPLRQTGTRTPEQTAPSTPILASAAIAPSP
jgi:signal transduction histidine kinase